MFTATLERWLLGMEDYQSLHTWPGAASKRRATSKMVNSDTLAYT